MASLSSEIIAAVASKEGVDERNLSPPLYEAINPDALAALYRGRNGDSPTVAFPYKGYRVVVNGPNAIEVEEGDAEV